MEENKNLVDLCSEISDNLYEALNIVDIFYELVESEVKQSFLLDLIKKDVKKAFNNIEICRKLISYPD